MAESDVDVPQTRASRRGQREGTLSSPVLPALAAVSRPLVTVATVALAAVLTLCAFVGPVFLAAAVGLVGLLLAWGWPALNGSPSRVGSSTVLGLSSVAAATAAGIVSDDPYLRFLPLAMAASVIGIFLHQLLRRDGRPRLSESVAVTAAGVAVISSGAALIPLPRLEVGDVVVAAAAAAVAAGSLADLLSGRPSLRAWMLPLAMLLGGGAAVGVMAGAGGQELGAAALIGVFASTVAHAMRRVLAVLPPIAGTKGQLAAAAASLLVTGAVVYVPARLLLG
ncbi:MAG: hypothetical protein LWW86_01730 [Micrococcales bacterium]|nr:hypothetical protein [Micrococcales bacterium]